MNFAVGVFLIALIPVAFWISGKAYSNVISPISVFLSVWLVAIGLFLFDFIEYVAIDASTWLILVGSIATFCGGCAITTVLGPSAAQPQGVGETGVDLRRLQIIFFTLCILGFFGYVFFIFSVGRSVGLDALLFQPYLFRAAQSSVDFSKSFQWERTLNYLNVFTFVLGTYCRSSLGLKTKAVNLCIIGSLFTTCFSFERTTPFMAIIWAFFASQLGKSRLKTLRLGVFVRGAAIAVLLVGVFVAIGAWLGKTFENNPELQRSWRGDESLSDFALPFVYLTGNIPGFQEYMKSFQPGETYGQFMILPVVKSSVLILGLAHQPPQEVREFMLIPFAFNTSTYLNVYWSDFGLFGVLVMPFFLGVMSTFSFVKAATTGRLTWILFASLLLYALLHSVFVNKLISTPFWLFTWVIAALGWIVQTKKIPIVVQPMGEKS